MDFRRYHYSLYENVEKGTTEFDFLSDPVSSILSYIKREPTYATFTSKYVGNIDLLAYEVYKEELLYWVIAVVNGVIDPFDDAVVESNFLIPHFMDIYDYYKEKFNEDALT